jgi:hypothetical protein
VQDEKTMAMATKRAANNRTLVPIFTSSAMVKVKLCMEKRSD